MSIANGAYTRNQSFAPQRDSTVPRFHMATVEDHVATAREGRPIAYDEERVQLIMGGSPHSPVFKVTDEHRQRWPEQYERFKKGQEMSLDGTPLEMWSILKPANVYELKALNFFTVEQLAEANDVALQKIPMYGQRLRELAKAYLDESSRNALATKLAADNDRKDAEIAALRLQVENMAVAMKDVYGQLKTMQDTPNPLLTVIPGMGDPVEQAKAVRPTEPGSTSSLASLAVPRRGRKPMPRDEAGNIIREAS